MRRYPSGVFLALSLVAFGACSSSSGSAIAPVVVEGVFTYAGQRTAAQESLEALQPLMFADVHLDLGFVPDATSVHRGSLSRHRFATETCSDGFITSVGPQTTQNVEGVPTTTTPVTSQAYYDSACTKPWRTFTGTETTAGIPDDYSSYTVTGKEVIVSESGAQIETDNVNYSNEQGGGIDEGFVVTASAEPGMTSSFFAGCGDQYCDHGDLQQVSDVNASFGLLIPDVRTTLGISSNGLGTTFVGTIANTMFVAEGCCNGYIMGGEQANNLIELTRAVTVNADGTGVSSATSGLVDTALDAETTATFNGSSASGVVTRESGSTAPLATYTIDVNGYGSIRYADGSRGTITAFVLR